MTVPAPSQLDLRQEVHDAARRARVAARRLASLPTTVKDRALHAAADELLAHRDQILAANAEDLNAAREADTPAAMLDRLSLNPQRVDGIAAGLRQVAGLRDPVGEVLRGYTLPNGLQLRQQRVPLGVVGMIYEGRPNVTVDAFGLTLKSGNATKTDVFSEEFLLQRPLLTAIRRTEPTVLLIDETDKADIEIEGLLLEVLSDFAVTVPELGTLTATRAPFVLLTSNATRELSEALKRRCLYLHIDFPTPELERRILLSRVPELPEHFAEELVRIIGVLRGMQLKKVPSIAETIDWGRTVLALGLDTIDDAVVAATLGVVLKHQSDQQRATGELRLN